MTGSGAVVQARRTTWWLSRRGATHSGLSPGASFTLARFAPLPQDPTTRTSLPNYPTGKPCGVISPPLGARGVMFDWNKAV